jgi:hypothetical protein
MAMSVLPRGLVLCLAGAGVLAATVAVATIRIQTEAGNLGYPAKGCEYCHTFNADHMRDKARALGIATTNCYGCHGDRLPKSGDELLNPRGLFLRKQKSLRNADRVDPVWLKDYAEPPAKKQPTASAREAGPRPNSSASRP